MRARARCARDVRWERGRWRRPWRETAAVGRRAAIGGCRPRNRRCARTRCTPCRGRGTMLAGARTSGTRGASVVAARRARIHACARNGAARRAFEVRRAAVSPARGWPPSRVESNQPDCSRRAATVESGALPFHRSLAAGGGDTFGASLRRSRDRSWCRPRSRDRSADVGAPRPRTSTTVECSF